jgi:hypothetical protein
VTASSRAADFRHFRSLAKRSFERALYLRLTSWFAAAAKAWTDMESAGVKRIKSDDIAIWQTIHSSLRTCSSQR